LINVYVYPTSKSRTHSKQSNERILVK
jgi:hypothetical protein